MFQTDNKAISKTQDISSQSKINNFPLDFHEKNVFSIPTSQKNQLVLPSTVQSWFSDIKFSDNLWFSDYFTKTFFNLLHKIIRFSDSFYGDQKCH